MRVIENNFNRKETAEPKQTIVKCEHCGSKFEYDRGDVKYGSLGVGYVNCPCCNKDNYLDNEYMQLTIDNIEFPTHFYHFDRKDETIDEKFVKDCIGKAIKYFRNNKEETSWFTATGDIFVNVNRFDDDEMYMAQVTKGYYEVDIPFESVDY